MISIHSLNTIKTVRAIFEKNYSGSRPSCYWSYKIQIYQALTFDKYQKTTKTCPTTEAYTYTDKQT
jgi:hypothetical protein